MTLLWLQPNWSVPSELWMQRMREMVAPHLCGIGANSVPAVRHAGAVPVFALEPHYSIPERAAVRLGLLQRNRRSKSDVLLRWLRRLRPRKILIHYLALALETEAALAACDAEVFVHGHGFDVTWDLRVSGAPEQRFFPDDYCDAVRRLAERATIIANSRDSQRRLHEIGVPPQRVALKYLGVPVRARERTCADKTEVQILYLGRLLDCKGPDLTIRAFEIACDRGLEGRLIIAGDGDMRITCELMRERSRYRDRIRLLGAVDAATGQALREASDIFAAHNCFGPLSRQTEALGVSILEAMADGLPVVSGRSGGVVETVIDGATGILVEPGDIEAQAEAFVRLASDPALRHRLGIAGRQHVAQNFSLEQERSALLRILGLGGATENSQKDSSTRDLNRTRTPHLPQERSGVGRAPG